MTKHLENTEPSNSTKPVLTAVFLTPYLPYDLKVKTVHNEIILVEGIYTFEDIYNSSVGDIPFHLITPILRPTTDLHCDFEIDDCNIYNSLSARSRNDLNFNEPSFLKYSYEDIQILLKHHFDIFGLIKKGLAISIHDVV